MKSTRKVIITILILVLVCMFFVACNDKGNPNDNDTQQVLRKPWAQPDPNNCYDVSQNYDYSQTEFEGVHITVELTNSESMNNLFYDYKIEDFGTSEEFCKIEQRGIDRLMCIRKQIADSIQYDPEDLGTINPKRYVRSVRLYLTKPGKDNALKFIDKLTKKYYICQVKPDFPGGGIGEWFATSSNDPYTSNQWGLEKIKAYDAWDIEKGNSTLTVGNIDSGIKQTHEDLIGNMSDLSCGTDPYTDSIDHGTKTAGIIGAVGNNGKGISGVCWNIKIASLKACIGTSDEVPQLVIAAIEYAKVNNIKLLNFSGGFYSNQIYDDDIISLRNAIATYNGLIVVAAGNENLEIVDENSDGVKLYPQSFNLDNIIVVGASNINDERWVSNQIKASNYSSTIVDLFAPGMNIYTTSKNSTQAYKYDTGTSMSAPFVTGIAALIWSVEPNLTATQVKSRIMQNVDPIPALSNMCVSGGRLNAQKALEAHAHNKLTCTYASKTIRTGHYVNCNYCDYSTFEAHMWNAVKVPGTDIVKHYLCGGCGAITDIIAIPNPTSLLTPNALALMNEKESSTSGDYEFEITQDIVFVKKNGKYYLMVACDENGNIIADLSKVLKKEETI